jgi:hypothetical protein
MVYNPFFVENLGRLVLLELYIASPALLSHPPLSKTINRFIAASNPRLFSLSPFRQSLVLSDGGVFVIPCLRNLRVASPLALLLPFRLVDTHPSCTIPSIPRGFSRLPKQALIPEHFTRGFIALKFERILLVGIISTT